MNFARKISQLFFDFGSQPPWKPADGSLFERSSETDQAASGAPIKELTADEALTQTCRELLIQLDLTGMAKVVQVFWNPRLRSTAGYASYPSWRIELNPRLREFEGQTERTLRHELAHLVAYHRAGRRRIEPHGGEWKLACADLGIPGESARHTLPLPRRQVKKNYIYACAHCGVISQRVRKFRRGSACRKCCDDHNGGKYDAKYRFVLIEKAR
jgi:SprT protein